MAAGHKRAIERPKGQKGGGAAKNPARRKRKRK